MLKLLLGASQVRLYVWASLVTQILIVVTGGAVRLTGSGLGCPTWPECQTGSYTTVPPLGMHGVIEFANRLLTFVLLLVAVLTFLSLIRLPRIERKGLVWPALVLGLGIIVQAVIGGITVLTGLNSWIVGAHFLVSGVLIAIATILVWRFHAGKTFETSLLQNVISRLILLIGILAIVIGVIVTGSGPHAGDSNTPRNGLSSDLLVHLHSYPAYILLILSLFQTLLIFKSKQTPTFAKRINLALLAILAFQVVVGITQARIGLPIELVALHMLGAATLASALTMQLLIIRRVPRS